MSQPIMFFKKNKADYQNPSAVVTASEGGTFAPFVQRRSNGIGWMTTGSVDANHTTLTVNFNDIQTISDLILVKHNFANFNVKYWNGSAWTDFSPAVSRSGVTESTTRASFSAVQTTQLQLTINGTQVPNSDKKLSQFIATELIGQLKGWPTIKKPSFNKNKQNSKMLSGKVTVGENVGGFACDLEVKLWSDSSDLSIVETLYGSGSGFLVWLCGGDQSQFSSVRQGYRLEDFFLMKCTNDYSPEWFSGLYSSGLNLTLSLAEVTV
jgi:hypothetical protein